MTQPQCKTCKHCSNAWAGESWDRCHHPNLAHLIRIRREGMGQTSASLPKCVEMRRIFRPCGITGKLFEELKAGDALPEFDWDSVPREKMSPPKRSVINIKRNDWL